ncbi:MAG: DUF3488 and transglutaminase-like domain-containing protein [Dactylosporangium sp.]|nr:DUF3488 and transglutaminase-like domain-containing protein [Dactylosporangium sp.]
MLSRIYAGVLMPQLAVGAAVGVVGVSLAASRLPAWSAAPLSVICLVGYTAGAVKLAADSGDVPGDVAALSRDALHNGIPRLLTAMIPIEPQPDTVVVPVLAIWIAGLAAAELAIRGRLMLVSYAPLIALLGGCLYVVGPNAGPDALLAGLYAGCAALGLAASTGTGETAQPGLARKERSGLRLRIAVGTAAGLAMILAAGAVLAPMVAARIAADPTDPRQYVTPPQLDSLDESPLARLSGWALDPDQHLFDARLSGGDRRLRLAVLSDYDGVTWRVSGNYRTAGRILSVPEPDGRAGGGAQRTVEQKITIDQLDGRLLPAATMPERIDGVRVAYDPDIATIALPDGLRPGLTYTVLSRPPTIEVNLLPTAGTPQDSATIRRFARLPGEVPADIERLANQIAEQAESPYLRALAIERFISEHYQLVADAPSGHAYPNLDFFLFAARNTGGQKGTSEQFAAAFAVLSRALGMPTRLAVGFEVSADQPAVRGANALAWPEVLFDGVGWVAFNPLPEPNSKPKPVEEDFVPKPDPPPPSPSTASTPPPSSAPPSVPAQGPAGASAGAGGSGIPPSVVAGGIVLVCLVGTYAGLLLALRARRRRRLWAGAPNARVVGAWDEVHDALRLAGRPPPASLSATEVSAHAATATGGPAHVLRPAVACVAPQVIADLADLVNLVVFGRASLTEAQADQAVAVATSYVAVLRARRPRWRRMLWAADPRPLWWTGPRRRRPATRATV